MKLIENINNFFKKANTDHVGEYTAGCAYYTFLSFIPFIILLLSLVKYIDIEKEELANIFEIILPSIMKSSVLDIIQEVYSKSIETVSISAIFILWSASKGFYALTKGLSAIYKKEEDENYIFLRIKGVIGAIFALIIIIFILLLLVFGNIIEENINNYFGGFSNIIEFILKSKAIISIAVMFIIFLLMNKFSSGVKGLKKSAIGALFTAIAVYISSIFFSIYVNIFTNFSVIYGSLATITVIMMWLYTIIYVIFLGAEINVIYQEKVN